MQPYYIYVLIDPRTEEVRYVGKTININIRFNLHMSKVKRKSPHKENWINQLRQEGLKPIMLIVEETDEEHWKERERHWQLHFEKLGADLTNCRECGSGRTDYSKTPESLARMREIVNRLRQREDVREKYRQSLKERWQNNQEYASKMRSLHKGRKRPEETGRKISEGLKRAHERRKNQMGGQETLQKHTPLITGLIDPEGNRVPPFRNVAEFCRQRGMSASHLRNVIKGKRLRHRGYTFRPDDTPGDTTKVLR